MAGGLKLVKPELLAPAGDFEKLKIAIAYGADAVYLSGTSFGLRAKAKNFSSDDLAAAITYAHDCGVRVFITVNIFAHNDDIDNMSGYFAFLKEIGADAFIISDPGVLQLAKEEAPGVEIHISTQANTTNYASASFWHSMGASRIILARELSLKEIADIRTKCPPSLGLEGFVHGAMCMSYSGRCMLSKYMSDRDANLGACAHPCRYNFRLYAEELSRPGEFMPLEATERGTDIFAADDLCMIEYIPEMTAAGLNSLKIEGRMKSAFYVGLTTKAYRMAIDSPYNPYCIDLLKMASHRPFSTGFYFDRPMSASEDTSYSRSHDFAGIVVDVNGGAIVIEQRGVFELGDTLTFIQPKGESFTHKIKEMQNENGVKISRAPHAKQKVTVHLDRSVELMSLVSR